MYYCGLRFNEQHIDLTIINEGESIILQTRIGKSREEILRIFENRPRTRVLAESHPETRLAEDILNGSVHEWKSLTFGEMNTIREKFGENLPQVDSTHHIARLALFHWKTLDPPEDAGGDFLHELAIGLDENEE